MNSDDIKKLRIISIDPSLISTGVYCFNRGHGQSFTIKTRGKDRADRLVGIYEGLSHHISQITYDLALVEDYAYSVLRPGKGSATLTSLGEVRGVLLMALRQWAIPVVDLNITIWKTLTMGHSGDKQPEKKTKAGREAYLAKVHELYVRTFKTTDEADAYMMFRATGRIMLGAARTKAMKKLAKEIFDILGVKGDGKNREQHDYNPAHFGDLRRASSQRSIEPPARND